MSLDALSAPPLPAVATRACGRTVCAALFLLVFAAGGAVGGAVGWRIGQEQSFNKFAKPQELFDSILLQMKHDLNLDETQRQQVTVIMQERRLAFEALRREIHPRFLAEFSALEAQVSAVLTPAQLPRWKAFLLRLKERMPPTPEPASKLSGQAESGQAAPATPGPEAKPLATDRF